MTSEAVSQIVQQELAGHRQRSNAHGCDLSRCLVTPVLLEYYDPINARHDASASSITLWLVMEESPEDGGGYKIVYDEQVGMFGLAVAGTERDVFIGLYGTFLETYAAM